MKNLVDGQFWGFADIYREGLAQCLFSGHAQSYGFVAQAAQRFEKLFGQIDRI